MVPKMKMQQQTGSNCAIAGSSVCNAIANAANGNGHAGSPEINGNCTGTAETFLTGEDMRCVAVRHVNLFDYGNLGMVTLYTQYVL